MNEKKQLRHFARPGGFTLPELLVGVAILFALAVLVSIGFRQVRQSMRMTVAKTRITQMAVVVEQVREDIGYYPSGGAGEAGGGDARNLDFLARSPGEMPSPYRERWRGPYVTDPAHLVDPWGTPYFYRLIPPPPVPADPVFGPVHFSRDSGGEPFSSGPVQFPPVPGGWAMLLVDNTLAPVVSGRILLNGREVAGPDDFRVNNPVLRKMVEVNAGSPNIIEVSIASWRHRENGFGVSIDALPEVPATIVFGPVSYSRASGGQPFRSGPIPFDPVPGGQATLVIDNSRAPVVAGRVYVNGREIVRPNDFRVNNPHIRVPLVVNREAPNTLDIWIASWRHRNNAFELTIEVDPAAPEMPPAAPARQAGYLLGSYGADGQPGGSGEAADIIWHSGQDWISFD